MSASKKTVVAIGAVAALGVAAAVHVVRLVGERSDRQIITSQVNSWAETWAGVRACLAGEQPTLARTGHAFLLHQAARGASQDGIRACEPLLRTLTRPGEESTGDPAVETAWQDVRARVKSMAQTYAGLIDPLTEQSLDQRLGRMAVALDEVEAAYAALRKTSRMEPAPAPGTDTPAELGEGVAITVGGMTPQPGSVKVAGSALVVHGSVDDADVVAVVRGPGKVTLHPPNLKVMRAADDTAWGVWFVTLPGDALEMRAGALGPDGAPAGEGVTLVRSQNPNEDLAPAMALGRGLLRAVVYRAFDMHALGDQGATFLVRSTDGGTSWSAPVLIATDVRARHEDIARRRIDIDHVEGGALQWISIRADALDRLPPPRRVFDSIDGMITVESCFGDRTRWSLRNGTTVRVVGDGGPGAIELPHSFTEIARCDDTRAILTGTMDGAVVASCDHRACKEVLEVAVPGGPDGLYAVTTSQRGGVVAATQVANLIAVWRPGESPVPFIARDGQHLRDLIEWDGALHAVMVTDNDVRLVPLP